MAPFKNDQYRRFVIRELTLMVATAIIAAIALITLLPTDALGAPKNDQVGRVTAHYVTNP